eukprot:g1524.t1
MSRNDDPTVYDAPQIRGRAYIASPPPADGDGPNTTGPSRPQLPINTCVFDIGSHVTRFGWAGNREPLYTLPTCVATHRQVASQTRAGVTQSAVHNELNFDVGVNAQTSFRNSPNWHMAHPVHAAGVADWDAMERFWHQAVFNYLRASPEKTEILVVDPGPFFTKEFKTTTLEVLMEVLGFAAVAFVPAPVLAVYAAGCAQGIRANLAVEKMAGRTCKRNDTAVEVDEQDRARSTSSGRPARFEPVTAEDIARRLENLDRKMASEQMKSSSSSSAAISTNPHYNCSTALVIDVGYRCTRVIPVVEGYPLYTTSEILPVGGAHVSDFILDALVERKEPLAPEVRADAVDKIKATGCYLAKDLATEFARYFPPAATYEKEHPQSKIKSTAGGRGNRAFQCEMGPERFLAPEIFFQPQLYPRRRDLTTSKRNLVDCVSEIIEACPIDYRRSLYGNVILCGGSSQILFFGERLRSELEKRWQLRPVATKVREKMTTSANKMRVFCNDFGGSQRARKNAAWYGGSLFATHSRQAYEATRITRDMYRAEGGSRAALDRVFGRGHLNLLGGFREKILNEVVAKTANETGKKNWRQEARKWKELQQTEQKKKAVLWLPKVNQLVSFEQDRRAASRG